MNNYKTEKYKPSKGLLILITSFFMIFLIASIVIYSLGYDDSFLPIIIMLLLGLDIAYLLQIIQLDNISKKERSQWAIRIILFHFLAIAFFIKRFYS